MADELRIGLSELLRKAMIEQDADFLNSISSLTLTPLRADRLSITTCPGRRVGA